MSALHTVSTQSPKKLQFLERPLEALKTSKYKLVHQTWSRNYMKLVFENLKAFLYNSLRNKLFEVKMKKVVLLKSAFI